MKLFSYCIVSLSLLLSPIQLSFSQTMLKGRVVDNKNESVDYYLVNILSDPDSTVILTGSFITENFGLEIAGKGKYILDVSSMGYSKQLYPFSVTEKDSIVNLPVISLNNSSYNLNEVVVTGRMPLVTYNNNKSIVNIENSVLSDAGSITDMLSRTPGLISDVGGQISVMGKGSPIIYIDNKEVVNKDELNTLQSNDISKVEIIRNPSSRYNASGRPVIVIRTKRSRKDNTMIQLYNNLTIARKVSDRTGLQIIQNTSRYSGLYSYSYGVYNQKQYADYFQTIYNKDYTMDNISNAIQSYSNKNHNLFAGIDYQIRNNDYLGLKFAGSFTDDTRDEYRNQKITKSNISENIIRDLNSVKNKNDDYYTIDFNYTMNRDSVNTLNLNASYAHKKYTEKTNMDEIDIISADYARSLINSQNKYDVYYLSADYQFEVMRITSQLGGKYSKIKNNGYSENHNLNTTKLNSYDSNITNEEVSAAYLNFSKNIRGLTIEAGIRYEYTDSKVKTTESLEHNRLTSSKFFPNIGLNYVISPKAELNINYNKSISRQLFSQINPNVIYLDSLSYIIGNPYLKPSYSDNFEIGLILWKKLNFTASVETEKNPIVFVGINDDNNTDITRFTYMNLNKAKFYNTGLSYSITKGNYTLALNSNLMFPDMTINYMNREKKIRKMMSSFTLNNSYNIPNIDITVFLNFNYRGPGDYEIRRFTEQHSLIAGVRKNFLKDRLKATITMYDIFHKNSGGNYDTEYGNISEGMRINQDTRFLRISLSYTFNNIKTRVKSNSANQKELNRLY